VRAARFPTIRAGKRPTASGTAQTGASPASETAVPPAEAADDPDELTLEDLRPTQPEAPAGTSDYAIGWGVSEPIISSVDGVEVDPPDTTRPRRPDEAADDPTL